MPAPLGHPPYPGCETGGRPKKYTVEFIDKLADEFEDWLEVTSNIWFKDFCLERKINPCLMAEWAEISQKFSIVYKRAKHVQESRVLKGALVNSYNSTMAKMLLTNHHGWSDRQETTISGSSTNPFEIFVTQCDGKSKDFVKDDG